MRYIKASLFLVSLTLLMAGCAPFAYLPHTPNIPSLTKENELRASIGTSTSGLDIQGAYAITDQLGIMAGTSFVSKEKSDTAYKRRFMFEAGVGYFQPFSEYWHYEIYGGLGLGSNNANRYITSSDSSNDYVFRYSLKNSYEKIFAQGALVRVTPRGEVGFALRLENLYFNKYSYDDLERAYAANTYYVLIEHDYPYTADGRNFFFMEPGFFVRAGKDPIKGYFQLNWLHAFSGKPGPNSIFPFTFSFGLQVRLKTDGKK